MSSTVCVKVTFFQTQNPFLKLLQGFQCSLFCGIKAYSEPEHTVYWSDSRVLTIIPTMETATKLMEVTETTWARVLLSECSIRSHRYFW